jgi:hypothetical protein
MLGAFSQHFGPAVRTSFFQAGLASDMWHFFFTSGADAVSAYTLLMLWFGFQSLASFR